MTTTRLKIDVRVLDYKVIEAYIQERHHFKFIREYPSHLRRDIKCREWKLKINKGQYRTIITSESGYFEFAMYFDALMGDLSIWENRASYYIYQDMLKLVEEKNIPIVYW